MKSKLVTNEDTLRSTWPLGFMGISEYSKEVMNHVCTSQASHYRRMAHLTVGGAMMLLVQCVLPGDILLSVASSFQMPHEDCILCGITRAFMLVSAGAFEQAASLNRGAVPLCLLLTVNTFLGLGFVCRLFVKAIHQRARRVRPDLWIVVRSTKEKSCRS